MEVNTAKLCGSMSLRGSQKEEKERENDTFLNEMPLFKTCLHVCKGSCTCSSTPNKTFFLNQIGIYFSLIGPFHMANVSSINSLCAPVNMLCLWERHVSEFVREEEEEKSGILNWVARKSWVDSTWRVNVRREVGVKMSRTKNVKWSWERAEEERRNLDFCH